MRFRRRLWALILLVTLCVAGVCPFGGDTVFSAMTVQAETLRDKLNQAQQEKNEIQNQLNDTKGELKDLKGTKKALQKELNNLNDQLAEVSEKLEDLAQKIEEKEFEISEAEIALEEAIETENNQYNSMVLRVRAMYEQNDTSYVNAIIKAGSLADMLNVADYFEKIMQYDRKQLTLFKENHAIIEEQKLALENDKLVLDDLQLQAEAEKTKISGLISQASITISEYSSQISEVEKEALAYEAELKKKNEDIKQIQQEIAMSELAANSAWRDISQVSFADGDRALLANLIYCEAGGEPYEGQLAVGAVVINRVLSSRYPSTVSGVIYAPKQFSPVASGRLAQHLAKNSATVSCYQAADEAMSGKSNVGNCVYFRTPIPGLTGIQIGGHIFY